MKYSEIQKLSEKDIAKRLKDLRLELVKSQAGAAKSGSAKTKEIKKIIARILTFNKSKQIEELKNK